MRSLIIATVVVAGVMWTVAYCLDWRHESRAILQEYSRVRGADGPTIATREFRGATYALANVRCRITNDKNNPTERLEAAPGDLNRRNSGEIWVTPPGKWVSQPSDAIRLLINNL